MTDLPTRPPAVVPDFSAPSSTGQTLSRDSFFGKVPLVMVFLPDLVSPRGLLILGDLDARHVEFGAARCQALGVVRDRIRTVREFAEVAALTVPVLADAGGSMVRAFGVEGRMDAGEPVVLVADKHGEVVTTAIDPSGDIVERALHRARELHAGTGD